MNRDFAVPGYVAIALAILFPIYWFSGLFAGPERSLVEIFRADVTRLSAKDGLFVVIGLMEIYIYMSLRRLQQQQLHGSVVAALSLCMAIVVGLYTATVLFDVYLALGPAMSGTELEGMVTAAWLVSLGIGVVVALVGLILAIALLVQSAESTLLLKLFAVLLLISSLLSLSLVLAVVAFVVYPIALVLLGVFFLRGGGEVEVV